MDDEVRWRTWQGDFNAMRSTVKRLEETFRQLDEWLREHVVGIDFYPPELPEPLRSIVGEFFESTEKVSRLFTALEERFSQPFRSAVFCAHLTEEEYYLARAGGLDMLYWIGFRQGGGDVSDDYATLELLYYTGARRKGYINVTLESTGSDKTTGEALYPLGRGFPPEWCHRSELRAEQHDFFRTQLPAAYSRFKD